jgi:deoxyribodipyrimidine photolyase-related protein
MGDSSCRHLVLVLGDQLDAGAAAMRDLDQARDRVWMCEAVEESTHVPSHKARILMFLSAMRHFRDGLDAAGIRVHYRALTVEDDPSLAAGLAAAIRVLRPERLILTEPGEHRVLAALQTGAEAGTVPLDRNESVRRRRVVGLQAICCHRSIYQSDEPLSSALPL